MSDRHRWERLISLMEQERDTLDRFNESSGGLRESLHDRNWETLEKSLKEMDEISERLSVLERKREALTNRICGAEGLETRLAELDSGHRKRFNRVRSELKSRLLTVRSRTKGIATYAGSRSRLGRELMEELVPATRGRIYDKRGRSASAGRDPMVLSRHL